MVASYSASILQRLVRCNVTQFCIAKHLQLLHMASRNRSLLFQQGTRADTQRTGCTCAASESKGSCCQTLQLRPHIMSLDSAVLAVQRSCASAPKHMRETLHNSLSQPREQAHNMCTNGNTLKYQHWHLCLLHLVRPFSHAAAPVTAGVLLLQTAAAPQRPTQSLVGAR